MQYQPAPMAPSYYQPLQVPYISEEEYLKKFCSDLNEEEKKIFRTKEFNDTLYANKRFEQLAKHGSVTNYLTTYNLVKDSTDLNEIINSKYFKGPDGFINILRILDNLKQKRREKTEPPVYGSFPSAYYYRVMPQTNYHKYNLKDYLGMINKFLKSDISDDLKEYYIQHKLTDIDIYYTSLNRDKISVKNLL